MLDNKVLIHRSASIAVLLALLWGFWRSWSKDYGMYSVGVALVLAVLAAVGGVIMFYFHVPNFIQPVHLLLSALMFAFMVWAVLRTTSKTS